MADPGGTPPWHAVFGDNDSTGVAPSKPAVPPVPTRRSARPEPIEASEPDVIAPVSMPPSEELMPTAAPALPPEADASTRAPATDPIRALGDSAVRHASLAASGAPTPIGGVPIASGAAPDPESPAPALASDTPAYTPVFGAEDPPEDSADVNPADGNGEPPHDADAVDRPRPPWWRSVPALVLAGLLVMGGIGFAVYQAFFAPDEIELAAPVVVEGPPPPVLEPIEITDPSDFLAAMPLTVGTFALIEVDSTPPEDGALPVRFAEHHTMVYSNQDTQVTVTVIQHYSVDAAQSQFEALTEAAESVEPLDESGGAVGSSVRDDRDDGDSLVIWMNGSVVFIAGGPAESVTEVFDLFGM